MKKQQGLYDCLLAQENYMKKVEDRTCVARAKYDADENCVAWC